MDITQEKFRGIKKEALIGEHNLKLLLAVYKRNIDCSDFFPLMQDCRLADFNGTNIRVSSLVLGYHGHCKRLVTIITADITTG